MKKRTQPGAIFVKSWLCSVCSSRAELVKTNEYMYKLCYNKIKKGKES